MLAIEKQLSRLADVCVACVGDLILDKFLYGSVERISPEAPTPVIRVLREEVMLGGVGNVARNVEALGGTFSAVGVVGSDISARTLRNMFTRFGESSAALIRDPARPTTQKTRFVSERYKSHLLRADQECTSLITDEIEHRTVEAARAALQQADVAVISDYRKGVVTPRLVRAVLAEAKRLAMPVVVDPKGDDYSIYHGANIITPNKPELARAVGRKVSTDEDVIGAARLLIDSVNVGAVLVTRSEEGMTLVGADGGVIHIPAFAKRVVDVSGAGDTVVATFAMMLALAVDLETAARVANAAAGVVVGRAGTATLSLTELREVVMPGAGEGRPSKVVNDESRLDEIVASWRRSKLRIGFTNGCFDLVHPGHVHVLSQTRAACDRLIVGLNSDASVRRLKGEKKPIQDEISRARVLEAFECVHLVTVFDEDTPEQLIRKVRPDVLVKGGDYSVRTIVGSEFVQSYGGEVFVVDLVAGHSSSRLSALNGNSRVMPPTGSLASELALESGIR